MSKSLTHSRAHNVIKVSKKKPPLQCFVYFFLAKYKIANRTFQISFDNDMIMIDAITGVGGIMVSIVDPGSIPGRRKFLFTVL